MYAHLSTALDTRQIDAKLQFLIVKVMYIGYLMKNAPRRKKNIEARQVQLTNCSLAIFLKVRCMLRIVNISLGL
jgi:hypothetical protein